MISDLRCADVPSWSLRDYVSPGLRVVRPDQAFPHLRPGDALHHPWKYLRRDVPHIWYVDERFPLMGFLNRDEATLLHNIALQFAGRPALEIGSWLGWSTCHLALAGVNLDVIDPALEDPASRSSIENSLAACGVLDRVHLVPGRSPEAIASLGRKWDLFFIDGDHDAPAPVRDTLACLPHASQDCAFVFHDLAAPAVAEALRLLAARGFQTMVYQTAQIMGMAWRGRVTPVAHVPDPEVAWQLPMHLTGIPISGHGLSAPAARRHPWLGDAAINSGAERPSICVVSNEIVGPFKNGGIGTAMTGLAESLAADGFRVTVLYTGGLWMPEVSLKGWKRRYAGIGIELAALHFKEMRDLAGPVKDQGFSVPWLVYRWLAQHPFDVIHFNECCGDGSLALAAKKMGLAFRDSLLVVALHSPSRWVLELNQSLPTSLLLSAFQHAEHVSIACADVLWSPSRYLADWAGSRGFDLPRMTFIQQYAIPSQRLRENGSGPASLPAVAYGRTMRPKEIVFFGRLEERKGLRLFCNAIDAIRDDLARRGVTVTFLGRPEQCAGMPAAEYVGGRSASWTFPVHIVSDLGQPEALQYLCDGERLAVMPSPMDNSPCTVYEALNWGIPFLATRTGGIPELVDEEDRDHVLFDYTTESLRIALLCALENGAWLARPARTQKEIRSTWSRFHAGWRNLLPERTEAPERSLSVAAIVDHRRGAQIGSTLQSLAGCPSVRRVVVLNHGDSLPFETIDLAGEAGELLNSRLTAITEDAVLLIHSGASVVPEAFNRMLEGLTASTAEGLQPAGRLSGRWRSRIIPPLGGDPAFSLYEGATFTGALLVRREVLTRSRTGRQLALDAPFAGLADFCVSRTRRLWPYPEVVVERDSRSPMETKSALPARIAGYDEVAANERYYMLSVGYGAAMSRHPRARRRELALAALDLGMTSVVRVAAWSLRRLRRWTR